MSQSKEDFGEIREFCLVEMSREFYEANEDLLSPPEAKLKSAYVIGESHKGDKTYQEIFERYRHVQEELREYEYLKRYKRYLNLDK